MELWSTFDTLSVACGATFPVGEGFCIRNVWQQMGVKSV